MADSRSNLDYDRLAADYARHRQLHPGVLAELVERGELTAASRVMEVGAGTGNYISAIADLIGCQADGVEPSSEMLVVARTRSERVQFSQGRAEALPFDDGVFDLVFSVDVIHHVGNRSAFFQEALRVLRPGGRIATVTDSADDIARRRPLSSYFPETVAKELERYPEIPVLSAEMDAAGFGTISETHVELEYDLVTIEPYRNRAYSSLHLIEDEAFTRGLDRLAADLAVGPIRALSLYTLLWGLKVG